ncbi:glycosyltransferase [Methylocella sp.]|uniref:glycosyltransferase n=1 Tax=Methylocella sp. TaxID=1978226 RepID=UPI003783D7B1
MRADFAGATPTAAFRARGAHASREDVAPRIVVALPARDEAERVEHCLRALGAQAGELPQFGVLLFVNNSRDETCARAIALAPALPFALRVVDAELSRAFDHAGGARRVALDLAALWLEEGGDGAGFLFTTDADSAPAPGWLAAAMRAFAAGADAVAGRIALFPDEEEKLSPALKARGALESEYEALLTEIFARLDPRPHDPWPRHAAEPGASLALTLSAYRQIGGAPLVPAGEDRALAGLVEAHGLRLRHELDALVFTSGRLVGRARGGVADALRLRTEQPQAWCDPYLEPAARALARAAARGRLRALHAASAAHEAGLLALSLGVGAPTLREAAREPSFHACWTKLEAASPVLRRRLLRPRALPRQIAFAGAALRLIRLRAARSGPADTPLLAAPTEATQSFGTPPGTP